MEKEYVVRQVQIEGEPCWTVVEYVNGQPQGGDAHWLTKSAAELAKEMYEHGKQEHGTYWWGPTTTTRPLLAREVM